MQLIPETSVTYGLHLFVGRTAAGRRSMAIAIVSARDYTHYEMVSLQQRAPNGKHLFVSRIVCPAHPCRSMRDNFHRWII